MFSFGGTVVGLLAIFVFHRTQRLAQADAANESPRRPPRFPAFRFVPWLGNASELDASAF